MASNPVRDNMQIDFDNTEFIEALPDQMDLLSESSTKPVRSLKIKDIYDKKMFKDGKSVVFDVSSLPRGTYYLHIINSKKKDNQVDAIRVILE